MKDHHIKLQIFYEIAMAIGNSLDLNKMLKESIQTYLRKLDFSAGIVFQAKERSNGTCHCEPIFSIPGRIQKNITFQTAVNRIPQSMLPGQWHQFLDQLPVTGHIPKHHSYCIMPLTDFGVILFIFNHNKMPLQLMKSLQPINDKLAQACNACISNSRMIGEIERRKKSEETALESKKRLGKILETVQAGIVIVDVQSHKIMAANSSALKMVQTTREQILGKICHKYICPDQSGRCPIIHQGETVNNDEKQLVTMTGERIPVLKSVTRIDLSGRDCLVESFIDLRRLKEAEEERDAIKRKLMHAQKLESLGRLSGGIAHDFNNILYAASGYTELALEDVPKDSLAASSLESIKAAHKRAADLIKQILAFSRTDTEERKAIQIQPVLEEAVKLIRKTMPPNIEIQLEIDNNCRSIMGDETRIHQIIINLCTNAFHAMQETGGMLTISMNSITIPSATAIRSIDLSPGHYIQLTISDTGKGMDEETKKRIFEPFFTTKEVGVGTGMGLSTVHGIVRSYGGGIHVSSEISKGSAFHVFLPACDEEAHTRQPIDATTTHRLNGRETILFLDDDTDIVNLLGKTLERCGYTAHTYTDSNKALAAFFKNPYRFDLVMTDMNMPNQTGIEVAEKMLATRPDIPIILCTGYSENINREKALETGIVDLILKPISKEDLFASIRHALDGEKNISRSTICN